MAACSSSDARFPLTVDAYYAISSQEGYGAIKKSWVYSATIPCQLSYNDSVAQNIKPNPEIRETLSLEGILRDDPRLSQDGSKPTTGILLSNIKSQAVDSIYNETSGPRKDKPTVFEIASITPFVGPFGNIEYYKVILRRSENQAVD